MRSIPVLNDQIRIEDKLKTRGGIGEEIKNWALIDTVWGFIEDLSGNELFLARQTYPTASSRITIRHTAEISNAHRLVNQSIKYKILHIGKVRRDQYLVITVESSPS
jgi:SPP1 family predicted phage head-tail adaptor